MTRDDAETAVWDTWGRISERNSGCEMQLERALTEEYEWGWVVFLGPVRREESRRQYPYDRFACERRAGRSVPVGTKGLHQALLLLNVVSEADCRDGTPNQIEAMWRRVTTRRD